MKKYIVGLEAEERRRLEQIVRVGKAAAYRISSGEGCTGTGVSSV